LKRQIGDLQGNSQEGQTTGEIMQALLRISRLIDRLNEQIGKAIMWLILAVVLISAGNAVARKVFHTGSNALLDLQWYLYSCVFLLGAGYAFLKNVHVRIDFVSSRLTARGRSWVDIVGIIVFLAPFCVMLIDMSWPLFVKAWQSGEMSQNVGGLIRWPVYLLMPLGLSLLLLQSASELIKRVAFLRHLIPDPLALSPHPDDDAPKAKTDEKREEE
jgi:TRAP-type mannitol/chloroaromatic compound transport system permease small subunit